MDVSPIMSFELIPISWTDRDLDVEASAHDSADRRCSLTRAQGAMVTSFTGTPSQWSGRTKRVILDLGRHAGRNGARRALPVAARSAADRPALLSSAARGLS